tara:strand:+ start:2576 stop:3367 length:792 start_codon:yes stop_codon:yes gene_type:complete
MGLVIVIAAVIFICYAAYWWGRRSREKDQVIRHRAALRKMGRKDSGEDNFEGWFIDGQDPQGVSANLEIGYCDAVGNETVRKIHVRQFDPGHRKGMLLAHCYLRDASRSFRVDRIRACVDTDTGEVVADILQHLKIRHAVDPERIIEVLSRDYRDLVRVLGYMGMADGDFSEVERTMVAEYIRKLARDERVTPDVVATAATRIGTTSLQGFKIAVGKVVKSGGVSPILLAGVCREIAEADGIIKPEEQEALDYIDRRILSESV